MEEKVRQGYLYDFYGELLNEHQREIYESFVMEDLSLAEIALAKGISRQAVHDVGSAEEILKLACREEGTAVEETMERIRVLSTDILEEL